MSQTSSDEARKEIAEIMSNYSHLSPADASFRERTRCAELRKEIDLKRAYREDLRRLNAGLYALKLGVVSRSGNGNFHEQLMKDLNDAIKLVDEKQRAAACADDIFLQEQATLSISRQAQINQYEAQKLQGVLRMQEQLRSKLNGTRIMKQVEREKANMRNEENVVAQLEVALSDQAQKRGEMRDRKHREIIDAMVQIGEGQEQLEELRAKLADSSKQMRDDLHDVKNAECNGQTDGGGNEPVSSVLDVADDGQSGPLFDPFDWKLGNMGMNFQLNENFKNPNDFPDILTRLSSMNRKNLHVKDIAQPNLHAIENVNQTPHDNRKKKHRKRKNTKEPSSENTNAHKKPSTSTQEDASQEKENMTSNKNRKNATEHGPGEVKTHQNFPPKKSPVKISPSPKIHHITTRNLRRHASIVASGVCALPSSSKKNEPPEKKRSDIPKVGNQKGSKRSAKSPSDGSSLNVTDFNKRYTKAKYEPLAEKSLQPQSKKRQTSEQKQSPDEPKKGRLSTLCRLPSTRSISELTGDAEEPIEGDTVNDEEMQSSASNNSLDFGIGSSNSEFDMNLSGEFQPGLGDVIDEDLDFLSMSPSKAVPRNKGAESASGSGTGDMDGFDFAFGGTNSSESMDQEDLF